MSCSIASVETFIQHLTKEFKLDVVRVKTMWEEIKQPVINPFIRFMREQRPLVQSEFPTLKFGAISTEIAQRWKVLSDDERASYGVKPKIKTERPFIQFNRENRAKIRKEFPTMKFGEISKEIGKRWRARKEKPKRPELVLPDYESIQEYSYTSKKTGEQITIPLVATPWLVTKALRENYDGPIVYCDPTPPPSPGSDHEVVDEEEQVDQTHWNDYCRNYYTQFLKDRSLEHLKNLCVSSIVPVGSRNRMIAKLITDEWYTSHEYVKKKYGLNSDAMVYEFRLTRVKTPEQRAYLDRVYEYLSMPSLRRRYDLDDVPPPTLP